MNFGQALALLKMGERVAREGWNGKGMWLHLVVPGTTLQESADLAPGLAKSVARTVRLHSTVLVVLPFIGMKTANNEFVPWLASQTDLLAEDWVLVAT